MGGEKEYRKRNALRARDDYFDEWGRSPSNLSFDAKQKQNIYLPPNVLFIQPQAWYIIDKAKYFHQTQFIIFLSSLHHPTQMYFLLKYT